MSVQSWYQCIRRRTWSERLRMSNMLTSSVTKSIFWLKENFLWMVLTVFCTFGEIWCEIKNIEFLIKWKVRQWWFEGWFCGITNQNWPSYTGDRTLISIESQWNAFWLNYSQTIHKIIILLSSNRKIRQYMQLSWRKTAPVLILFAPLDSLHVLLIQIH